MLPTHKISESSFYKDGFTLCVMGEGVYFCDGGVWKLWRNIHAFRLASAQGRVTDVRGVVVSKEFVRYVERLITSVAP